VKIKKNPQQNPLPAKPTDRHSGSSQARSMSFPFDSDRMEINIDYVKDDNHLGDSFNIGVYVISVALEAFTSTIIDFDAAHYNMAHYINDHAIIYECFNEIISLLFEMELDPSKQSLVTHQYILECIFFDDNCTFVE
jgi:hypothetical protein